MKGIDVSHWQGDIDWGSVKTDFAFMKVSEGTGFFDEKFVKNKKEARDRGILCGYYHFARANDPVEEADWFISNVGDIKKGELVALDYEIYTLNDPSDWCRKWLDRVESKLGFKPLLYTYDALLKKYNWSKVSDGNFGLWAARYGLQQPEPNFDYQPSTGSWAFWAIWQYTSKGSIKGIKGNVDLNYSKMDIDTLKKYGSKLNIGLPESPSPIPDPNEDNVKKILKYLGRAMGEDFGNSPNDGETKRIKEFLETHDKGDFEELANELEDKKKECDDQNGKLVETVNSLKEVITKINL